MLFQFHVSSFLKTDIFLFVAVLQHHVDNDDYQCILSDKGSGYRVYLMRQEFSRVLDSLNKAKGGKEDKYTVRVYHRSTM